MVSKQEIYGGQSALGRGISETIKRRTERFQEQVNKEEEKQADIYLQRINSGEIKNINEIPTNLRKYFNIEQTLNQTKDYLNSEIQNAKLKEQQLKQEYDNKVETLRQWKDKQYDRVKTREEREEIRKDYEYELINIRQTYIPQISYFQEFSKQINEKVSNIDKGDILSRDYILDYAKSYAEYERKSESNKYKNQENRLKIDEAKVYIDKVNKGEITLSQIPKNLQKFISVNKETTTGTTIASPNIELSGKDILNEAIQRKGTQFLMDVNRYRNIGYNEKEANILALESQKLGMSLAPSKASQIITEAKIKENAENLNEQLKTSFKDIFQIKQRIEGQSFIERISSADDIRNTLTAIQNFANTGIQALASGITSAEYKVQLERVKALKNLVNNFDKRLGESKIEVGIKTNLKKDVSDTLKRIENLENKIQAGTTTFISKAVAIGTDIVLDFAIPIKGYADVGLLLNQIIPRKEDFAKVLVSSKENGFKNTLESVGTNVTNKVENFLTNKEQKKELESVRNENLKQIAELENGISDGTYDKVKANYLINDLKNQNKIIDEQNKEMNQNSLLTIGTLAFIVGSLGRAKFNRLKAKDVKLDLESAKKSAKINNELEAGKLVSDETRYVEDVFTNLKLNPSDLKYLQDNLKVINKGVVLDDVESLTLKVNSKEYSGNYYVRPISENLKIKKPIIEKIESLIGKKTTPDLKIKYYVTDKRPNYFQNSVDLIIQLKNGKTSSFSLISKSNKNLQKLVSLQNNPNIVNTLKYGTNKKLIITEKLDDSDIVGAIQFRTRAGRLTPEEYYLGREIGDKTIGVKTSPKVLERLRMDREKINKMSDKQLSNLERELGLSREEILRQTRLSPEEMWGLGTPKAVVKDTPKSKISKEVLKITDRGFLGFTQTRQFGIQKIKNNDVTIDLSTFNFVTKNNLENLKSIPAGKRTRSQKVSLDILNEATKSIKDGKSTLIVKNNQIKQLSAVDLSRIQSSISSTIMDTRKFNRFKDNIKSNFKNVSNNINKLNNGLTSSINKINQISSEMSSFVWTGISSTKALTLNSELEKMSDYIINLEKLMNSQNLIITKTINNLNEELRSLTAPSQVVELQQLLRQQIGLKSLNEQIISSIKRVKSDINQIKSNLNRLPKIKIPKTKVNEMKNVVLKDNEYGVFARKYGKDFLVGKRNTKKKAESLFYDNLENTLRASGLIKKGKEKVKIKNLKKGFRPSKVDPFRVVEKVNNRINTIGEKRELRESKKNKQKSAERYWFG